MSEWFEPKCWFPGLRRIHAAISRVALRQWWRHGDQGGIRSDADVLAWCADQWDGAKALVHYLRIKRRTKSFAVQLSRKFTLTAASYSGRITTPGHFLWRGFRKHRSPGRDEDQIR